MTPTPTPLQSVGGINEFFNINNKKIVGIWKTPIFAPANRPHLSKMSCFCYSFVTNGIFKAVYFVEYQYNIYCKKHIFVLC